MKYAKVKNWDKYQHYSDRNPPWIKLYNTLLDDYEYSCLQDDSKLLLMSLFLLASRTENKIPADPKWIRKKAMLDMDVDLEPLVNRGFVEYYENDSTAQASCKSEDSDSEAFARSREQRREESEKEAEQSKSAPAREESEIPATRTDELGYMEWSDEIAEIATHYEKLFDFNPTVGDQTQKRAVRRLQQHGLNTILEVMQIQKAHVDAGTDCFEGNGHLHALLGEKLFDKARRMQYPSDNDGDDDDDEKGTWEKMKEKWGEDKVISE
jgi:hypothetical protein